MTTTRDDISIVLSGSTGNIDPNASLGGNPSATPVTNASLNNLFDDVLSDESEEGNEEYRCIYVFNDGDTAIWNTKLWISDDFTDGAAMELGIQQRNEVQRITISGDIVTGGSMTLAYEGEQFVSSYNADLGTWGTALQTQLRSLVDGSGFTLLKDVTVTAQNAGSDVIIFDITFTGRDGKRNHDTLAVVTNALSPSVSITITTPSQGGPINTVAPTINVETTPPGGVTFFVPTELSPLSLPYLRPTEGFPVWVKRNVTEGTVAKENDGFVMSFSAESLEPL